VDVARLLPDRALKPRWSSATALVYIGAFVALTSTTALFAIVQEDHGDAAFVGYSVIAFALALGGALWLEQAERAVAAGVLATITVLFFGLVVGAFENLVGLLDLDETDDGYQPGLLVVELVLITAAGVALRRFRAPLLVLVAAVTAWAAVADLGSLFEWDDAGELLSLAVGVVLIAAGVVVDGAGQRGFGFWLHAVGGVALGGAVVALVSGGFGWALVGLLSLVYVGAAYRISRSSYAVLGAVGILTATAYFSLDDVTLFALVPAGEPSAPGIEPWQSVLWFVGAGLLIIALGLLGDRLRREAGEPEA